MKKEMKIEGMSCQHCAKAVAGALSGIPGVEHVEVLLAEKKAVIECGADVADALLRSAVDDAGFETIEIL